MIQIMEKAPVDVLCNEISVMLVSQEKATKYITCTGHLLTSGL